MTKKRHTASRMLLALVALTLVSFCFLGSTFARYTSTGTGTAITQVAEWSITGAEDFESASAKIDFQQLSPSAAPYYASAERTHSTGKVKVAAITNNGDVNAKVWFTASAVPTITGPEEADWGAGIDAADGNTPTQAQVQGLFSIVFYYSTAADSAESATTTLPGNETDAVTVNADGGVIYIYAEVTWTSVADAFSDKLDTWVGMNVTSVGWTLNYTAVQTSTQPATGA